jgi:hypothetical protein
MKHLPQFHYTLTAVARAPWYQDRPLPGYPLERLCRVTRTVKVTTRDGWARWSYCTIHGWVAPSSHLIEVLTERTSRGQVRG